MANLTITIDEHLLRRARIRAIQQGTSVNAVLRRYLEMYAGDDDAREAMNELIDLARSAKSGSGKEGRRWTRNDLHER